MADAKLKRDIDLLIYKRDNIVQKIEFLHNQAETLSIEASPIELSEFKVRCDRLPAHYESFERYQSDIVKGYVQLKDTSQLEGILAKNKVVDEKYFFILATKDKFLSPLVRQENVENVKPIASTAVRLPKINLPTFEGVLKDWPHYKDLFLALVHNNVSLSPVEKLHFLLSSTKGEPHTLVKGIPICSDNYELVWTQLNERYDNKRLLAANYIDEILSLTPIHFESPKPLRTLLDTLNENTSALKQMEIPDSLGEFIILHVALKTVDRHTRQLFERKFSNREYPSLSDFIEFLKEHCKSLEAAESDSLVKATPTSTSKQEEKLSPAPTSAFTCIRPTCDSSPKDETYFKPTTILLGTAIVRILDVCGNPQQVRALIDAGSQSSFITESCVSQLCLPRRKVVQPILGLSEVSVSSNKGLVPCVIKPLHQDNPSLRTEAIVLNRITSPLPSTALDDKVKMLFQGWDLADPEFYQPGRVDLLIGADLFPQLFDGGRRDTPSGFPTAFHTIFGWLLIGESRLPIPTTQSVSVNLAILDQVSLESNLRKFWEIEEPPMNHCQTSPEDERCESIYASTVQRDSAGRFVVDLPFKNDCPDLGESYSKAKHCFLSLERKFNQNPDLKGAYSTFMNEYRDLGHMSEVVNSVTPAYYIPHHGIFKKNSSSSKLRVVFNASAPTSTGKSLNDELLIGPKLQTDICKILSLFRLHLYVFTTDIEKMYRQILVNPQHKSFQAILWRDSPEKPMSTFLLNTVTYGVSSSPFLALRSLRQLALEDSEKYPLASEVILNSMFVDDVLTGGDSLDHTLKIKSELISLLNSGGFKLRKWSSNNHKILEDVPSDDQEFIFGDESSADPSIKVLGLKWNPNSDKFSYDVHIGQPPSTKRGLLSQVSKVYDPLGLITPVVLWAKCLIQKIWTLGLDWDQPLPIDIVRQSSKFFETLPHLSNLTIPRLVLLPETTDVQLHGFSDASEVGYGCAIYLRVVNSDGKPLTNLIMAKSKVAPLKKISIPRLELCGAVLLSKTMFFCKNMLAYKFGNIPTFAWTDSLVTLHWIRTAPHQLKTFVANRVAELQTLLEPACWRHTPTDTNPADYASRGLLPHEILRNSLWWIGPNWLMEEPMSWPTQPLPALTPNESLLEFRPSATCALVAAKDTKNEFTALVEKHSQFTKLQSCIGWILRFIHNCQKKKEKITEPFLTSKERASALHLLVKLTQSSYLPDHIDKLATDQTSHSLQRLSPFLDEQGLIRVGGRLKNSQLPYNAKFPMLLPKQCHLTNLLIDHYHLKHLHVGPRTLQSLLSQQFWIISARQVIRHRLSKCLVCVKMKANSIQPYMGNLPGSRITQSRPFLHVGIDFGGPFTTKTDKLRKPQFLKSYVCLFICFSTKAIHLESVSSLSTEAFLACFDRFVSRRGLCAHIYSDQATNFVGADRELQELHSLLHKTPTSDAVLSKLAQMGISWHFNPPAAPHFGGLWESGIKSMKYHLKRVVGNQILTFEEFSTLLTKVEAVLNSRPLCSLSTDPNEYETLTPGHFLIGEPLVAIPQTDLTNLPQNRLSRWQMIQQAQRSFWKVWSQDYLHQLQQRYKWTRDSPNLKINDLVLIKDKNLPPLKWTTARVIQTHPGKDGIVRVATLKTPAGQLQRPVVQLCPLPQEN
ncbi:uncharacterized protein LOC129003567 [Macrosteles quadrilineatus]|uniref:uncharacterized protein LOC129003567 n=1 Tax=Macrosteles quadrilineatus TaxID=74068 RepID=UPI0023E21A77|nr:uncharacterized protein LOC129003567 [Macrosteles quadrilineatus]